MQVASSQGPPSERRSPPSLPAILNLAVDRFVELDRRGQGHGREAAGLSRLVAVGIQLVANGTLDELTGPNGQRRFAWPDRPAPFPEDAA